MKMIDLSLLCLAIIFMFSAGARTAREPVAPETATSAEAPFDYAVDRFADIQIARYQVPGFEALTLKQKKLVYYLSMAGLAGRDITWDQNYKHNLRIRRTLGAIVESFEGDRSTAEFEQFMTYVKQVWFASGIHHHYSSEKLLPRFSREYFTALVKSSPSGELPLLEGETIDELVAALAPVIFNPEVEPKKVNLAAGKDLIATSAVNFYENLTQKEVEGFYAGRIDPANPRPVSWGLNSKLIKDQDRIVEKIWKIDGMYGPAITEIVSWLEKAVNVAETGKQKTTLENLIEYYRTGDLAAFDAASIAWVEDIKGDVDFINGFIEVYDDPLGLRGTFEGITLFRDRAATQRIEAIAAEAQWFEDNSPIRNEHKKKNVKGISAKVATVVSAAGDATPNQPIGINLPNADWIRKAHGSKSFTLGNISHAYKEIRRGSGLLEAFAHDREEIERSRKYGVLSDALHTDLHEVIGHASGQLNPGVGSPNETLKNYANVLEECRSDLVALYYLMDPKLIEIGIMDTLEVGKEAYDFYIRNGLMVQLSRLKLGENIEQTHMRNRQMVARWAYEHGKKDRVVGKVVRDGETYFEIYDYDKLRLLFGQLLREVQRIKSEGDFEAGRDLIETYGVRVDPELHAEVLERFAALDIKPSRGLINPTLTPVFDEAGNITDIELSYDDDFVEQMMRYDREYSFLPHYN